VQFHSWTAALGAALLAQAGAPAIYWFSPSSSFPRLTHTSSGVPEIDGGSIRCKQVGGCARCQPPRRTIGALAAGATSSKRRQRHSPLGVARGARMATSWRIAGLQRSPQRVGS